MNPKKTIRKILFITLWVILGGGMLTLLIAAIGRQKKNACRDYVITIKGVEKEGLFLTKQDVADAVKSETNGKIKGRPKADFNLLKIENRLKKNDWVKNAEVYFDNKDLLHIRVIQREPVARVFTTGGRSFYLDEEDHMLKLSEKKTVRVPVFTGFPDKKIKTARDSALLQDVRKTAMLIQLHSFWSSMVAQVDLVPAGTENWEFDMVPVIGNHLVKLGNGEDMASKLNRLLVFYQQVLSRTGFDKYETVDVRFAGQVIGRKPEKSRQDSIQRVKKTELLIREAGAGNQD